MSYKNWVVVEFWKLWETILNHLSLQSKSCNFFAQHGYEKVIDLGFFWKITYIVILLGLGWVWLWIFAILKSWVMLWGEGKCQFSSICLFIFMISMLWNLWIVCLSSFIIKIETPIQWSIEKNKFNMMITRNLKLFSFNKRSKQQ